MIDRQRKKKWRPGRGMNGREGGVPSPWERERMGPCRTGVPIPESPRGEEAKRKSEGERKNKGVGSGRMGCVGVEVGAGVGRHRTGRVCAQDAYSNNYLSFYTPSLHAYLYHRMLTISKPRRGRTNPSQGSEETRMRSR